jgi:hypothetical protein
MATRWIQGGNDNVIVVDDTYFPVVVATWIGPPTEGAVRGYFAWLDALLVRATRESAPIINITDAGLAGVPSGDIRRLIAELTHDWGRRGADTHPISAYVVVDNAVVRGVLSALSWLHGDLKTTHFATCEAALAAALVELARVRFTAPTGLVPSRWRRPAWAGRGLMR